jgi:NAD(P)-dependent dehydrogenase (short-subunit alcohol dehydrogenase family)
MGSVPAVRKNLLLVGASRGLGYAMAGEFLERGWNVVGTIRGTARTRLHELSQRSPGRVEIETVDITMPDQIKSVPNVVSTLIATQGKPGLHYLDYLGRPVPW